MAWVRSGGGSDPVHDFSAVDEGNKSVYLVTLPGQAPRAVATFAHPRGHTMKSCGFLIIFDHVPGEEKLASHSKA